MIKCVRWNECDHLARHVEWFELLWLSVVRPSECDHLARHVEWYVLLWCWSWIAMVWDWIWECPTLDKFYLDVLWWINYWFDSYGCASGHVHLRGHFNDDPREGRSLIPFLSYYVICTMEDTRCWGLHKDRYALWGKDRKQGSVIGLELEWMLCWKWGMTLNSVGIHWCSSMLSL